MLPLPPGTSLSWRPQSSLYCCHISVSMISAADRNLKISASPWMRVPVAYAVFRPLSNNVPPIVPAPTASDFPKNERRLIPPLGCVFGFSLGLEFFVLAEFIAFMPKDRQQRCRTL